MDTGDLLLLVALIVLGLLGLVYVAFVLGNRGTKQYLLSCPPCGTGGNFSSVAPKPVPGVITEPAGALSVMPAVPPVAVGTTNSSVPLTPLAPATPLIPTGSTLLFRNRASGKYLSVCDGCSPATKLVVLAHESNPNASYVQWKPIASGNGWLLSNKFSPSAGVLQQLPETSIYGLKQNDLGAISTVSFRPADSQGYFIELDEKVMQTCCASGQNTGCACPQFTSSASAGVISVPLSSTSTPDARQIWDLYVQQANGVVIPLLQLTPAQRFIPRHR